MSLRKSSISSLLITPLPSSSNRLKQASNILSVMSSSSSLSLYWPSSPLRESLMKAFVSSRSKYPFPSSSYWIQILSIQCLIISSIDGASNFSDVEYQLFWVSYSEILFFDDDEIVDCPVWNSSSIWAYFLRGSSTSIVVSSDLSIVCFDKISEVSIQKNFKVRN